MICSPDINCLMFIKYKTSDILVIWFVHLVYLASKLVIISVLWLGFDFRVIDNYFYIN